MSIRDLQNASPAMYYYDTRDQLKRYVYGRSEEAFAAGDAARDAVRTPKALDQRRTTMRKKFIESLGGLPPSSTPLNAKVVGTVKDDGFHIENVIFESRPKNFVTANLYIPDDITSPRGAVLFVSGHHMQAKHEPEYQIVCRYMVKAGLIVLAQDPIGQGERFSYYEKSLKDSTVRWGTREHDYLGGQLLPVGDALARYFVHDAMRGIDYLRSRPEVDARRIGVTGNSGGGTQTTLMMMCDPRIAAAAPATFLMNRQTYMYCGGAQDAEQIWPGMTALGWDHEDILLMMTPKPVLVLAVTSDFFPIEGTRRTVDRCRRFWNMYGKRSDLVLFEDFSDHKYTRPMAKKAAEFFSKHLLGKGVVVADKDVNPINPPSLWCTKSGQVRGEIPGAKFAFEENLDRLAAVKKGWKSLSTLSRRKKGLKWLRERVFAGRKPVQLNPRFYFSAREDDLSVRTCFWWSQEGVINWGILFRDFRLEGKDLPVTIAVWERGTHDMQTHDAWIRNTCRAGRAVLVLDVSGVGGISPNPLNATDVNEFYGSIHKFNDDLLWLNDSIAALRVFDVIRSLDMVAEWPSLKTKDIRFYAHGRQGMYAQLAAALDDRVQKIEVVEGMGSVADWVSERYYDVRDIRSVIIPGLLKHLDLSDLK